MHLQWPDLDLDVTRIRRMRNLPYILLGIGVIFALLLLLSGSISYGVAILGFIVIVVLAYYTWRLLD
jgi:multisubunit Na+/H+ antiporter MnhE subunit